MAETVLTVALETIGGLVIEEGKFLFGVRDQVEELLDELEALQSFLKDAKKYDHQRVRTCVSHAKRLAYEAEDMIEEYAIKVAPKRGGGFTKVARRALCIAGEGIAIHKAANKIGKMKSEIASLITDLKAYGIKETIEAQPSQEMIDQQRRLRITYAHEVDEYFVGMEDDVSKIVKWVTEDDKIRRIISICGCGGSGKTTIARKVFNHFKKYSERSFECFAWVSVTQQCQMKILMKDILNQILGDEVRDLGEETLVRMIYSELENKKCFVVLDDIWTLDDWESLRPAFPLSEGRSKILLTTRITQVAEVAHPHSQHKPKLLDDKDGWELLTKIALKLPVDQGNKLPATVKNVGTDMLRMCRGLPLAISALGGILRNKDPLTEWETVSRKFETYLSRVGGVASVFALSYDDLPSYLRSCFLYMGCFKEDEEINVTRLYHLWMAEGLISRRQRGPEETLMDVASDFLHELICRNMVQPIVISNKVTGEQSCRLHNVMRGVCLHKGREEEFMEVKSIRGEEVGSFCIDGVDLCRQTILVDCNDKGKISIAKSTGETWFRALIFNQSNTCIVEGPMKFKRLRSLILDNCTFKDNKLPEEIRDMIHLRYLSLRHSLQNGELPIFIGDLEYIQILDVYSYKLQLPNIFHKMKRLRCLYLPYFRVQSKSGKRLEFHGLNELEVVEGLDSRYDQFTDLSHSVNLQRLKAEIWDYEDLSTILEQLSSLVRLKFVSITFVAKFFETEDPGLILEMFPDVKKLLLCKSLHILELWSPIGNFPGYEHRFWPNLVTLELIETKFEKDPMPFLQELYNLRSLQMYKDAYLGKEMYCSSKAFPKLKSLLISELPNIKIWKVDAGAFPKLKTLHIRDCESFEEIVPDGLTSIRRLTRIKIGGVPEEFINRYGSEQNKSVMFN